ncbi:hypothetical protein TorRG33x02_009040, partial [Trema orientale]
KFRSEDGRKFCDSIQKLNHLESLTVSSTSEDDIIDLESMCSPPQFLRCLHLKGGLRKLPDWIPKLQNLVRLRFKWSKLEDDPLKALQNLHNLLELGISYDAYYGEKLHFEEGTFPKLKTLGLLFLSKLRMLEIEEGALSNLEVLHMGPCPQLKESSGFEHLRNLKELLCEIPINFLMFQNFQSLRAAGASIQLFHRINGVLHRFEGIMETLEFMRDHTEEEWKSEFENILSIHFEAAEKLVASGSLQELLRLLCISKNTLPYIPS